MIIEHSKLNECCESGYNTFPTLTRTITLLPSVSSLSSIYVSHSFSTPYPISLNSVDDWCIFNYFIFFSFFLFYSFLLLPLFVLISFIYLKIHSLSSQLISLTHLTPSTKTLISLLTGNSNLLLLYVILFSFLIFLSFLSLFFLLWFVFIRVIYFTIYLFVFIKMLQTQNVLAAIVPDVDQITSSNVKNFPPNLDLQNDGETYAAFSYAV